MSTRKIKDAVDHGTKEFIYFKGHAKATYMSDGSTVEDTINNIESKIDLSDYVTTDELEGYAKIEAIPSLEGYVKESDLPNFDEFAKTEDIPSLDDYAKLEDIPEIPEIPSLDEYATKEWVNNKNYATEYELKTIDYSSINNTPTLEDETGELNITDENGNIGMKVSSEAVYAKDFIADGHKLSEKVNKDYVDNSIAELVDGAPETLNTLNEISAALKDNVDIVDVLNQSISSKQDKLVSGTNIKTINGTSILGSGDITIEGGTGNSDANVQAVDEISTIIDVDMDKYIVETTDDNITLDNNKYYKKTNVSSSISITLNVPEDNTVFTSFSIEFTTSETGTSVSLPDTIKWLGGEIPTFENNFTYQISICNGLGVCAKYA